MKKYIFYIFLSVILSLKILDSSLKYQTENESPKYKSNQNKHDEWIVITSINEPTDQIKYLANIDQFQLLVVGDKKTNQSWHWKNAIFLSIENQDYRLQHF